MLDRSVLSRAYFKREMVAKHHIDSFNEFLDHGIQKIVDEQDIIETDIDDEDIWNSRLQYLIGSFSGFNRNDFKVFGLQCFLKDTLNEFIIINH